MSEFPFCFSDLCYHRTSNQIKLREVIALFGNKIKTIFIHINIVISE